MRSRLFLENESSGRTVEHIVDVFGQFVPRERAKQVATAPVEQFTEVPQLNVPAAQVLDELFEVPLPVSHVRTQQRSVVSTDVPVPLAVEDILAVTQESVVEPMVGMLAPPPKLSCHDRILQRTIEKEFQWSFAADACRVGWSAGTHGP